MSWAATALCSLSWAGVLSLFATSSSVNPQLMSLFPALLFKKFLRALQQVTAERVRDEKSMGPIWGSQSLELWKWKHLEQAGAAGGEVKTDWWLTGRCLSRTPCANLSVFLSCSHAFTTLVLRSDADMLLLLLFSFGWQALRYTCACLPSGPSQYQLGRWWKAAAKAVLPKTCLY